jgi:hypothetical protein
MVLVVEVVPEVVLVVEERGAEDGDAVVDSLLDDGMVGIWSGFKVTKLDLGSERPRSKDRV